MDNALQNLGLCLFCLMRLLAFILKGFAQATVTGTKITKVSLFQV